MAQVIESFLLSNDERISYSTGQRIICLLSSWGSYFFTVTYPYLSPKNKVIINMMNKQIIQMTIISR
ncbi:MAG: hypothetical protein ACI9XO_003530 [Paraglaciecola sp.]|jgi:hypothetical protein